MRTGAYRSGDRYKRRGFAFAPTDKTTGGNTNKQGILAAVALERDLGHRQIEEVDRFDFHGAPQSIETSGKLATVSRCLSATSVIDQLLVTDQLSGQSKVLSI
jgi:hypothetical protein